ncbi:MAG: DNA-directed RNA polymerase subunit alpha [Candidatus Pacebacteria bacterium]|nr:DNA-directed RNA polymerase subunit alpha [Candidatus Paceibacterota bacterium]
MQISLPQKPKYTAIDEKTSLFEIDGCYPGYGTTVGNALRRVLLSSMPGAAITSVKIKGVKHEFSTIPGVSEDVIQIILNLKQVRFRLFSDEPATVTLKAKGEKAITAGMFDCPSNVEVVNSEFPIATITSGKGEIEMEMEISSGIGYVPVEQQDREKKEVGVIAVDAIYTPIKRVNYTISNMRVGKRTDFEKISLEVATDGSITPLEAFSKAVDILVDQFSVLKSTQEAEEEVEAPAEEVMEEKKEVRAEAPDPKKTEVTELKNLSTRTLNVLESNKVKTVGDIVKLTEDQLNELEGMGAKGIKEIKKAVGDFGLNLKKAE